MLSPCRSYCVFLLSCLATPFASRASAVQNPPVQANTQPATRTSTLSGDVSDPSGAKVPEATVHLAKSTLTTDVKTDANGHFSAKLPAGVYDVTIVAAGFSPFITTIKLGSAAATINARLAIATEAEEVNVAADAGSTAAGDNKSALTFKGSDLNTFSSDDSTFQQQIQALAGSGDSQNGPQVYVNGFSNGRFPPKNSIREIRINQNPYSAQYDSLGYGRIEILTKPGSDALHGYFDVEGNNNSLNTQNPYATAPPPYHSLNFEGNVSGPINKTTSFFLSGVYNDQQNNSNVNATTLNPTTLAVVPFQQSVSSPTATNTYSGRLDKQFGANNTFTGRYEFNQVKQTNSGVGLLVLPSEGTNLTTTTQTLQLSNSQIIGSKMVSEAHFQYLRTRTEQDAVSSAPTLNVEGAFNGGGNSAQTNSDNQDRYEFQELFTRQQGAHFLHFGARYRLLRDANSSTANFNGGFTFSSLTAYQITEQVLAKNPNASDATVRSTCVTLPPPTGTPPPGQVICGGASQFNLTTGQPSAVLVTGDLGLFAEDEWKLGKNFTLDLGMRFETQSAIPDHFDPAPRAGFAWSVGQDKKKQPIVTIRGGGGLFYDRFASNNILTSIRENGISQPSYVVSNPPFYCTALALSSSSNCPTAGSLSASAPTVYQISPNLRSEYTLIGGLGVERSLWGKGSVSLNYLHSEGVHQWNSANINAPLPGTYVYGNTASGIYPFGSKQPVYQYQSEGVSDTDRAFVRLNLNPTKRIFVFAFYTVRYQRVNIGTGGANAFPSNSYDIHADYGPSQWPNQRLFIGNFYQLPKGFTVNAFLSANSSQHFNITTGTDLNGDSQYNDRPAFATAASPAASVVKTRFGTFDTTPQPGETIIPSNYGAGPSFADLDFGVRKSFKFGPLAKSPAPDPGSPPPSGPVEKPDPRYTLSLAADAENVLNHVNPGAPVGVLSSPQFGKSISLNNPYNNSGSSATRFIQLHMSFEF
jgi:hypothetical protein